MMEGSVHSRSQDGVTTITIDRPSKRNAITVTMCDQLRQALIAFQAGSDRAAIICGAGDAFCAGADLTSPPSDFWRAMPGIGVELDKPLIAAVQGPVIGLGLAIVTFCDLCIASETAQFLYPEARIGVSKGLIASLATRIPHKMAMELMLTGGPLTAGRAYDIGFVNRVTPPGEQLDVACDMARALATYAPLVMAQLKTLVSDTIPRGPVEALYRTAAIVDRVTDSDDAREAFRAFTEKRKPSFKGT